MFDTRTLLLASGIGLLLTTVIMVVTAITRPEERAARYWAASYASWATGAVLFVARPVLPEFVAIVVANCAALTGGFFLHAGLAEFEQRPKRWWVFGLTVGITALALSYWTYIDPNIAARIMVKNVVSLIPLGMCVHLLLVHAHGQHWLTRYLLAGLASLLMAMMLWRVPDALRNWSGDPIPIFSNAPAQVVWFALILMLVFMSAAGCFLLLSQRKQSQLGALAMTDDLTGLLNRRALLARANEEQEHIEQLGGTLTFLLFDLDRFKDLNDRHGHATGDSVLRTVARAVRSVLRENDVLARYGGEEFCVLLPNATDAEASWIAERIRSTVESLVITVGDTRASTTVSVGLAMLSPGENAESAIARADQALYQAKRGGRNRVVGMLRKV